MSDGMSGGQHVRITEVGPRDGLQNEPRAIPTADKIAFVNQLSEAGFPEIEVTSFVSARWVPQLGDAAEVMRAIRRNPTTTYSALVPNERGLDEALACRVDKVSVFVSATEGFSRKNTNGTIAEVMKRVAPVVSRARGANLPVRGYVSCVIECPYDGPVSPAAVRSVCEQLLALGVSEIDLGDTIGAATPDSIARLYEGIAPALLPRSSTLHLHDTRGLALDCAMRALELGVRSFDSSVGGLGGCPYAPGARGNVATESLLAMLAKSGYSTGISLEKAAQVGRWMRTRLAESPGANA